MIGIHENGELRALNNGYTLGTGGGGGTSVPTPNTISKWDSNTHMNSEDMTAQEIDDFVDALNSTGNVINYVVETHTEQATIATNTYTETSFTATKLGYYPIGIVGYRVGWISGDTGKTNVYSLKITDKNIGSVTVSYALFNTASASITTNFMVDILWIKSSNSQAFFSQDFIVEQGTTDGWTYRKWNSGIAECWGTKSVTVTLSTVATYYHRGIASFSLPSSLFNAAPSVVIECHGGFWSGIQSISASTVSAYFFDVTNATDYNLGIQVSAKGKWK